MSSTSPETDYTLKCIALVQDRPQLWQKEHREFLNKGIRNKLLKELAQMCGLPCVSRCHTQGEDKAEVPGSVRRAGRCVESWTVARHRLVYNTDVWKSVVHKYVVPLGVEGQDYVISVFDIAGRTDYESVRAHTYHASEVLLLCFSVCDRESFYNVVQCWLPEIQRHTKGKLPLLLVGTQTDLRSGCRDPVSSEEGGQLASIIGADCYIECSARSRQGLSQVFEHVVFSALKYRKRRSSVFSKLFSHKHSLSGKALRDLSALLRAKARASS